VQKTAYDVALHIGRATQASEDGPLAFSSIIWSFFRQQASHQSLLQKRAPHMLPCLPDVPVFDTHGTSVRVKQLLIVLAQILLNYSKLCF